MRILKEETEVIIKNGKYMFVNFDGIIEQSIISNDLKLIGEIGMLDIINFSKSIDNKIYVNKQIYYGENDIDMINKSEVILVRGKAIHTDSKILSLQ